MSKERRDFLMGKTDVCPDTGKTLAELRKEANTHTEEWEKSLQAKREAKLSPQAQPQAESAGKAKKSSKPSPSDPEAKAVEVATDTSPVSDEAENK